MKRGRPFEAGNQFGGGRPRGSRNKQTSALEKLLEEYSPALLRKGLAMALQGDVPLLRLFLDRQLPKLSEPPVKIGRLPTRTIGEVVQAQQILVNLVASGNLHPARAVQIDSLLESRCKTIVTEDVVKRMDALELRQTQDPERRHNSSGMDVTKRLQAGRLRSAEIQSPVPDESP
jgi:hypothetical protein